MTVLLVLAGFVLLAVIGYALESFFKRDCGRPGCVGWEWTKTGHCSDCYQPVIGTSKATRAWRRFKDPR